MARLTLYRASSCVSFPVSHRLSLILNVGGVSKETI
jgi:hypothetical protein